MENEQWKDILGFEGIYQVSSFGRIKSLPRVVNIADNKKRTTPEKILAVIVQSRGYQVATLSKNDKQTRVRVNRVVAEAFLENNKKLPEVNHIDGNKLNNHYLNLEWCDRKHNIQHAYNTGLKIGRKPKNNN